MYKFINCKTSYQLFYICLFSSSINRFFKHQVFQLEKPQIICNININLEQATNFNQYNHNLLNVIQDNHKNVVTSADSKSINDIKMVQQFFAPKSKIRQRKRNHAKNYANYHDNHNDILSNHEINLSLTGSNSPLVQNANSQKIITKVNIKKTSYNSSLDNKLLNNTNISKDISIPNPLSIHELALLIHVPESEIIKWLFLKGIKATINQILDVKIATSIAKNYGFIVKNNSNLIKTSFITKRSKEESVSMQSRVPIITVLGHIDHGKTTLLQSLQKTKQVNQEVGGITQLIKTYEVEISVKNKKKQVIFLDTPGHEAFANMRFRGAQIADLAILVVAADDILGLQTVEAINYIKDMKIPVIVAINKIDKVNADINKIKEQLASYDLVSTDWGGFTPIIPVSAITDINIDQLISEIILITDQQELKADPNGKATGVILDAFLDKNKGPLANVLVQKGTLSTGDFIVADSSFAKVRAMLNYQHLNIQYACPSTIVEIWGFSQVPQAGSLFFSVNNEKEAKKQALEYKSTSESMVLLQKQLSSRITIDTLEKFQKIKSIKQLNVILKTDTQSSIEAILSSFFKLPQEKVQLNVISIASGMITNTDIKLASTSNSILIGFNNISAPETRLYAEKKNIIIYEYQLIYDLLNAIEKLMANLVEPEYTEELIGTARVNSIFSLSKGIIAGCIVTYGKITSDSKIHIIRNKMIIHSGMLKSLKHMKEDIEEAIEGNEFGVRACSFQEWNINDYIEFYRVQEKPKSL